MVCIVVALAEHVVNRGVYQSRELLWDFPLLGVVFFTLLSQLSQNVLKLLKFLFEMQNFEIVLIHYL